MTIRHMLTVLHNNIICCIHCIFFITIKIITLFNTGVKGVEICLEGHKINHCGKEGHWLETKMGIKYNAKINNN